MPTISSMCSNECSESSIGNTYSKHNRAAVGQESKRIVRDVVQALRQRIIATHISRWSACSQQNNAWRTHFYEGNKFAHRAHYRLKHQSVALFVVGSNMQLGTHGLCFAPSHTYLHTLFGGIGSARHYALRMQYRNCIKPLFARIQLALCCNCLPVGTRNYCNARCNLLIHC